MKAIISQPMNGKAEEQIRAERAETIKQLKAKGYEVVDTVFPNFKNEGNVPLKYLAKSIEAIADADLVYFMLGWKDVRGCKIEHEICVQYDVKFEEADEAPTVKMKKGDLIVNIRKTDEDILQAKLMGYVLVEETVKPVDVKVDEKKDNNQVQTGEGMLIQNEQKTGLAALSKKELFEYIGKRKLFDKSYKDMEPDAVIPLFINTVCSKIVEAKLKTVVEVTTMAEKELLELFDTLK